MSASLSGVATEIAAAPDAILSMLVTPQRQVIAFGCNEEISGTFNSRCIRWCDLENYEVWTSSATNNAGEHILDGGDAIIAARQIGEIIAVWTVSALYTMQFVGDPAQTFAFTKIADHCGLAGPEAVCTASGAAWWLAPDRRFRMWAPGTLPETIASPIGRDLADAISAKIMLTILAPVTRYDEIWCFYADANDGAITYPSRYVAFNRKDNAWFKGVMARSAVAAVDPVTPETHGYYAAQGLSIFEQDKGNTANGQALEWHIESADQYVEQGGRRMMLRGVRCDFEDQAGDISLSIKARGLPGGPESTHGPFTLTTATTKKDFRASGRIMRVRMSGGQASGSYMRLGRLTFDAVAMGER